MPAKATTRRRAVPTSSEITPETSTDETRVVKVDRVSEVRPPFLLDFYPLESPDQTRLARFYERLRQGRISTTKCRNDGELHWPPRTACPLCHSTDLDWIDLPEAGRIYAFSAVLGGAPMGMEAEVPFVVGLIDLEGVPLRLYGRIVGTSWQSCRIGQRVRVESYEVPENRVFYRFRVVPPSA